MSIWSTARYTLALSTAEFWALSPREYAALVTRKRECDRQALYGAAMVSAILANTNRDAKRRPKPFVPDDFLPKLDDASTPGSGSDRGLGKPTQSDDELMQMAKLWCQITGGNKNDSKDRARLRSERAIIRRRRDRGSD